MILKQKAVFISYGLDDYEVFTLMKNELLKHDFLVINKPINDLSSVGFNETKSSTRNEYYIGYTIALISEKSANSLFCLKEIEEALIYEEIIIPVIIGDFEMPKDLLMYIEELSWMHLPKKPETNDIKRIVQIINEFNEKMN